jgi:hypothetical protein
VELFSNSLLRAQLAFRGGTALHKLFLTPAQRYSEDIDLVQVEAGPIGPIMEALHKTLDPLLGEPRRKQSQGRNTFILRFDSEIPPITPLRLKVEINTREHFRYPQSFVLWAYRLGDKQAQRGISGNHFLQGESCR